MRGYQGDAFSIEFEWKEVVHYWEGDHGYWFDAGWGASPPHLYIPAPEIWRSCVPDWMQDRRSIIVERLAAHSGHVVTDSMSEDPDYCKTRVETR